MLIGGLVAVLGIGAAVGIAIASNKGNGGPGSSQGAVATFGPRLSPGPVVSLKPVPTQGPNPTITQPTPNAATPVTPTQDTGGGGTGGSTQTVSNKVVAVTVPKDWESKVEDATILVLPPQGGNLLLDTGLLTGTVTATQFLKDEVAWYKENRPGFKICGEEKDFQIHNGPQGRGVTVCYTATTSSGKTYAATKFVAVGMQPTDKGTLYFYLSVFAADTDWDTVVDVVNPVLPTIQWKLYTGS